MSRKIFTNDLEPRFAQAVLQKSNTGFGLVILKMSKTIRKMLYFSSSWRPPTSSSPVSPRTCTKNGLPKPSEPRFAKDLHQTAVPQRTLDQPWPYAYGKSENQSCWDPSCWDSVLGATRRIFGSSWPQLFSIVPTQEGKTLEPRFTKDVCKKWPAQTLRTPFRQGLVQKMACPNPQNPVSPRTCAKNALP